MQETFVYILECNVPQITASYASAKTKREGKGVEKAEEGRKRQSIFIREPCTDILQCWGDPFRFTTPLRKHPSL